MPKFKSLTAVLLFLPVIACIAFPISGPPKGILVLIKNLPDHTVLAKMQVIEPKTGQNVPAIKISQIKQDGPQLEFVTWGGEPSQPLVKGTLNRDGTEISGHLLAGAQKIPITLKKMPVAPAR